MGNLDEPFAALAAYRTNRQLFARYSAALASTNRQLFARYFAALVVWVEEALLEAKTLETKCSGSCCIGTYRSVMYHSCGN